MIHGGEGRSGQPPERQLAGRLALSAAALLLLALAYRYYRSRASAGKRGSDGVRAGVGTVICQEEQPVHEDRETVAQELRHRHTYRKRSKENGGPTDPNMHLSRPASVVKSRLQYAPVGRERDFLSGKEEEEEEEEEGGKQRMETSHPGPGLQPDKNLTGTEEEEEAVTEGETAGTVLSDPTGGGTADGVAATQSGGRPTPPVMLSQGCDVSSSPSDPKGPGLKTGRGSRPCDKQVGQDPPPLIPGNGPPIEKEKGPVLGEDTDPTAAQRQEANVGHEIIRSFHATSDMGLAVSKFSAQTNTTYTFSSVAKVHVEENIIKERKPNAAAAAAAAGTILRGTVYDYYVQSISQSVSNERPAYKAALNQAVSGPSPADLPNAAEAGQCWRAAQDSAAEEEEKEEEEEARATMEEGPPLSSGAHHLQEDADTLHCVRHKETDEEASGYQKPARTGRGLSRKGSFHQIAENPELHVQVEGFGPLPSRRPDRSTAETWPMHTPSVSSLVGSMQSLQTAVCVDATVKQVAGARFFHLPLNLESSIDIHLDLGNCYEVLCMAKKQKLERVQQAAYKVMSENYLQVLRTHAIYGRLNALERDLILQRRMRGRKYVMVADVSSRDLSHGASRLCYYDDHSDTWHPLTHVPMEAVSRGCAMCSMFNYLFVVAGCEGQGRTPSKRVFCLNPQTNIWREICPLNQARPHCKLVALDGCLYAIGGECLYTVERYDPRMDRWTFAAPLPNDTFAVAHTATVCDGEIYVTGGTLRYMLLRYVSRSDTWKASLTGASKDRTTEMVAVNGFIYRFDLNRSLGISVYRCCAKAKLWYECATYPMPFPACFQCAVVDNLVYCISRQFNIRFLTDYVSPRFGTKELQNFPSPRGTLFPVTLVLPDREAVQTQV